MTGDISPLPPFASLPSNVVYNNIPDCLALTTIDRETLSVPVAVARPYTQPPRKGNGGCYVSDKYGGGGCVEERVFVSQPHWLPMLYSGLSFSRPVALIPLTEGELFERDRTMIDEDS